MTRNRHSKDTQTVAKGFFETLQERMPEKRHLITKAGEAPIVDATSGFNKIRTTPICWGFPMDELCFSLWFTNVMNLGIAPWDDIVIPVSTYLPDARNMIHQNFLEVSSCEWLVMLDSDVLPPPKFIETLLSYKKPMIGGWYRKKGGVCPPVVYDFKGWNETTGKWNWKERTEPGQGLEKVDGAGAGCWLMHRSVAKALGPKPFDMEKGGEDLVLCKKVTDLGFEIFIDWNVACAHAGVGLR